MLTRPIRAVTACSVLIGLCLITALGGVNAAPAGAQTVPGTLSMHATIESVGVVAPYSGDDNQNNAALIWYRPVGESTWLGGPEMVVDRSAREWRVSLVYLLPGTDYEVEVRYTDPDGVTPASVGGTVATRPDYPDIGSGGHIRYVPDEGSLQAVIDAASPGDTIRLRAGTYHTAAELHAADSGTPGHYLTIEAVPGERVVLDGSDPDLNNTTVDNWHLYQGSVYYTDLAWGDSGCDMWSLPHYVGEQRGGDGMRYLLYQGTGEWSDFLAAPPGKAYYDCAGGRLYVVTYDGDDPDNHEIHVSRQYIGLVLEGADYVRVRDLEFRYYAWYGVHLAGQGADHNIIEGNTFHGIGIYHVRVGDWDTSSSSDNLIQDNHFYERGYRDSGWTWDAQYGHATSIGVRLNYAGSGNVVRRNTFKGGTDAIDVGWQSLDTDVYENLIEEYMDDGIEVDDQPGYNIRVWGNTLRYCYSGISNQGWFRNGAAQSQYWNAGPVYVFRNVIVGGPDPNGRVDLGGKPYFTGYAFKVGWDVPGSGRIYYYHNSIVFSGSTSDGNGIQNAGGAYFSGLVTRNNLWQVNNKAFSLRSSQSISGHDMDCDNLHNPGARTGDSFIQWSSSRYSKLSDFQQQTGQELHGISNNGTLLNPDLTLRFGSPEIDAGCVITGFNDHGPSAYKGTRPDIGAFEYANLPNLSTSSKTVSAGAVSTGDRITYTIRVVNTGSPLTSTAVMTDVLPAGLDYLAGTLTATYGNVLPKQGATTSIQWQGLLSDTTVAEIRFGVRVNISDTSAVINTARIASSLTKTINRSATIIVNGWHSYLPITLKGAQ